MTRFRAAPVRQVRRTRTLASNHRQPLQWIVLADRFLFGAASCWAQGEQTGHAVSAALKALAINDFSTIEQAPAQITAVQMLEPKDQRPGYCEVRGCVCPDF